MSTHEHSQPIRARAAAIWWLAVPALLTAALLTIYNFNVDALWLDEIISYTRSCAAQYGPGSLFEVIDRTLPGGGWSPTYYMLLNLWGQLAGWSALSARFLAFMLGFPTVALVYRMGRDMHSALAGVFAATVLSTTVLFVYYLHEARGYSIHVLMFALVIWLYWRVMRPRTENEAPPSRFTRVGLLLSVAGLLYTHPMSMPALLALMLYHLLFWKRNHLWSHTIFLIGTGSILFLPWFMLPVLAAVTKEPENTRGMDTVDVLDAWVYTFSNGLPLLLLAVGVIAILRLRNRATGFVAYMILATTALALLLNLRLDFLFHIRHLLLLTPLFALLIGFVLANVTRIHPVLPGVLLLLWIVPGLYFNLTDTFMSEQPGAEVIQPWPSFSHTFDFLGDHAIPEDLIVFHIAPARREHIHEDMLLHYMYPRPLRFAQIATMSLLEPEDKQRSYDDKVRQVTANAPAIWLAVGDQGQSPDLIDALEHALFTLGYASCGQVYENDHYTIALYHQDTCP